MKLKKLQANELPSLMQAFIKEKIQYRTNDIEEYNDFKDWELVTV